MFTQLSTNHKDTVEIKWLVIAKLKLTVRGQKIEKIFVVFIIYHVL